MISFLQFSLPGTYGGIRADFKASFSHTSVSILLLERQVWGGLVGSHCSSIARPLSGPRRGGAGEGGMGAWISLLSW